VDRLKRAHMKCSYPAVHCSIGNILVLNCVIKFVIPVFRFFELGKSLVTPVYV
jgi:hypothetical protein